MAGRDARTAARAPCCTCSRCRKTCACRRPGTAATIATTARRVAAAAPKPDAVAAAVATVGPVARRMRSARRTGYAAQGYAEPDTVTADTDDSARKDMGMRDAVARDSDPQGGTDGQRLAAEEGRAGNAENGS